MTKSLKTKLPVIVVAFCLMGAATKSDVIGWVLDSKTKNDLYGTSKPTMYDRRYVWSISDKLIEIILNDNDNDNDKAWQALHKFRKYTDAGLTTMYNDACFVAIKQNPLIFYRRFMSGDDQALKRAKNAVWGTDSYEGDRNITIESNIAVLKNSSKLINKISSNSEKHKKYLVEYKKALHEMIDEINHITTNSK